MLSPPDDAPRAPVSTSSLRCSAATGGSNGLLPCLPPYCRHRLVGASIDPWTQLWHPGVWLLNGPGVDTPPAFRVAALSPQNFAPLGSIRAEVTLQDSLESAAPI
ncbi:MAG: hypothetical protein R3C68_02415 [Myxococcota bacterium]